MNATPRVRSASANHGHVVGSANAHRYQQQGGAQHIRGHDACLCPACHIKEEYFPRRPDGRIVLPQIPTRHPSVDVSGFNRTQRLFPRRTVSHYYSDKGEGSSTGSSRLSRSKILDTGNESGVEPSSSVRTSGVQETQGSEPHISPLTRNTSTNRSDHRTRASRKKPYDMLAAAERPDPWPRIASGSGNIQLPSRATSHSGLEYSDPHGASNPRNSSVPGGRFTRQVRYEKNTNTGEKRVSPIINSPMGSGRNESNVSENTRASSISQKASSAIDAHVEDSGSLMKGKSNYPRPRRTRASTRSVSQPNNNVRVSPDRTIPFTSPRETNPEDNSPKIIRFPAQHNPQPSTWGTWGTLPSVEENPDANIVDAPLQDSPERRHNAEAPVERAGEGHIVGLIRFQDPMMPDSIQVPSRNIQVKWDSERKRRQGYFAQEEGDQKSPFRHYNKAGCDA